jgi:hypothetical protein
MGDLVVPKLLGVWAGQGKLGSTKRARNAWLSRELLITRVEIRSPRRFLDEPVGRRSGLRHGGFVKRLDQPRNRRDGRDLHHAHDQCRASPAGAPHADALTQAAAGRSRQAPRDPDRHGRRQRLAYGDTAQDRRVDAPGAGGGLRGGACGSVTLGVAGPRRGSSP